MKFTETNKPARGIALDALKLGDTFIYDKKIGMICSRNGHDFPLDLSTGKEFTIEVAREWIPHSSPAMLPPDTIVERVSCELLYQVR